MTAWQPTDDDVRRAWETAEPIIDCAILTGPSHDDSDTMRAALIAGAGPEVERLRKALDDAGVLDAESSQAFVSAILHPTEPPADLVRIFREHREGSKLAAQRTPRVVAGAIAFLREAFRDDGAEGESVHLLCTELERAQDSLAAARAEVDRLSGALPDLLATLIATVTDVPGCVAASGYCGADDCPHGFVEETICSDCAGDPTLDPGKHDPACRKRATLVKLRDLLHRSATKPAGEG